MEVIAEEFNAYDWGSPQKAISARAKRAAALKGDGYTVLLTVARALNRDYDGYILLAIPPSVHIRPVLPEKK